jgi:hypothetical protein
MAVYRTATLRDNTGLIYQFTEYGSTTGLEVFQAPKFIGGKRELVDMYDSVTMPKFSRLRKRAAFRVLAGYSGKNKTRNVTFRYVSGESADPAGTRYF